MITFLAFCTSLATSASVDLTGAGAAAAALGAAPRAGVTTEDSPSRMDSSFLFMALHMMRVSRKPEEPMMPPMATSRGSLTAKPAMAAQTPPMEFSSEMVMGMSAPPTRMVNPTPKAVPDKSIMKMKKPNKKCGNSVPISTEKPITPRMDRMILVWSGRIMGFCGRIWCSLPAATKEPVMVVMPMAMARQALPRSKAEGAPVSVSTRKLTMAAAPPPMPCRKATICGIWIILTLLDRVRPSVMPTAMASQSVGDVMEPSLNMVTRMARPMAEAQKRLPLTAVGTLFMRRRPNSTDATRSPAIML